MTLIRCPPSLFFGEKREDDMYHWTPYPQEHAQFINFSTELGIGSKLFLLLQRAVSAESYLVHSQLLNSKCKMLSQWNINISSS